MDAKRRPPPIPEKTVAGMPPAKPSPVPGPPPPTQLESGGHAAVSRKEAEGDGPGARGGPGTARGAASSSSDATDIQADGGANERFDPPVGGQFTSPAVAIMDPMKKARRKAAHPAYVNQQQQLQQQPQQQPGFQRAISPSQLPALPFGPAGGVGGPPARHMTNSVGPPAPKGTISASSSNGFHATPDGVPHQSAQNQTAAIQQQTAHKQLRSPTVKRAPGASVTIQGWLHKQGSDGLMLWKRRWFVLSEFCLFYYKGPEEEKVLGSILLPSYVISPCTSDERKRGGNRKHSFKAEHHNMRTYYFAADSLELMERWMHAMNLASFLQKEFTNPATHTERVSWDERQSGRPSVSSYNSLLNHSVDDSDSGFHGGRSPKHATIAVGSAATPGQSLSVSTWTPKGMKIDEETISDASREMALACRKGPSPEVPSLPAEFQPLYANAPPKPRRLNSGGRDYSTSPERSPERNANDEGGVVMRSRLPQNEQPLMPNGMYVERGERASRPMVAFASIRHERNVTYQQQQPVQPGQHPMIVPPPTQMIFTGVDRRTPDTYGRSNTAEVQPAANVAKMAQSRVDYEDVYNVSHNSDALGRVNRWSSGPYDLQHYVPNEIHQNAIQPPPPPVPTHVHHCPPPGGHSPQQGHLLHPHGQQQLGMMPRMPLSHPYSVSPTTAQHQHPPPVHQYPNQLMPPQPPPQVIQRRTPPLPRPHSADFLGHYEQNQFTYVLPLSPNVGSVTPSIEQSSPKMPSTSVDELHKQQPNTQVIEVREQHTVDIYHGQPVPRPKSSMDIRPYNQGRTFDPADYWSEESYARMMRQSLYLHAQHVHPSSSSSHKGSETSSGLGVPQQPSWPAQPQEPPAPAPSQPNQSRPSQSGQNQQTSDALEVWGKTSEDAEAGASNRQSGKRDLHQAGHFLRSASARMPRSRYNSEESPKEPSSAMSAVSGEEVRCGERKMQQREESMRRLLEWKQRMLQSPLTRKTSSSSGARKSNQDTSSYNSSQMGSSHYKQMVLKQLANQEAAASANNWEHVSRRSSSRRGPDDVRTTRSRSHDGRRSSASLSRYNSYSSDDEEAKGESRKRVRRGNQGGKGRRGIGGGSGGGSEDQPQPPSAPSDPSPVDAPNIHHHIPSSAKPSLQHPHNHHHRQVPPVQNGMYQNVPPPKSNHSRNDHSVHPQHIHHEVMNFESARSPQPFEQGHIPPSVDSGGGIPPDASYADVEASTQFDRWWGAGRNGRNMGLESHPHEPDNQPVVHQEEKKLHFEDEISRRSREIMSKQSRHSSRIEDERSNIGESPTRYMAEASNSVEKFGYEITRGETVGLVGASKMNGNENEIGLPKVVPEDSQRGYQSVSIDGNTNEEGHTSKLKSRKTLMDLRSKRENPPKNIVQNRIKTFEPTDEDEKDSSRKIHPNLSLKEPIKPSHSVYTYNEAHISSLRDSDSILVEEFSEKPADMHKKLSPSRIPVHNGNNGGATADIESSDDGTSSSPPPPLPVAPPPSLPVSQPHIDSSKSIKPPSTAKGASSTRSVRELLAAFERKSEEKKKMLESQREAQIHDGSNNMDDAGTSGNPEDDCYHPGRRYVFSDTETLLYDTGSDLDDAEMAQRWRIQRKEVLEAISHGAGRRQDRSEENIIAPGDTVEEADSEVESALRQNRATVGNHGVQDLRNVCSPLSGKGMERTTSEIYQRKDGGFPSPPMECKITIESDEAMEVITTPGYLRLSLAESLVTHEDLISPFGSSATATPPLNNNNNNANVQEEEQHYMPMTPSRKSILASPSSLQQTGASPTSASHSVIMESVFGANGAFWAQADAEEESSYVEMTEEGLVKSLLVSNPLIESPLAPLSVFASPHGRSGLELCRKSSGESTATYAVPESPRYSEIPGGSIFDTTPGRSPTAHYELLSRATTLYEPVYMEVRSVKEGGQGQEDESSTRTRTSAEKASPEKVKGVSASEEERSFRKEKKKKSKSSSSDREDTGNSSKSDDLSDRKLSCPPDNLRGSMGGILPDILNGSSNANNCRLLEGIGTDSSDVGDEDEEDADDEASKDLDSLDAPRHPRFSLSDTFRPASYYLGASDRNFSASSSGKMGLGSGDSGSVGIGLMNMVGGVDPSSNELHGDSSDSDLVSPPPIPTSPPPPLEDDDDVLRESPIEESDDRKSGKTMMTSSNLAQLTGALRNPSPGQRPVISPPSVQPEGSSMSDMSDTASTVCSLRRRPVTGNILDNLINSAPNKSDIPSELYLRRSEILNEYGEYKKSGDFDSPLSPSLPPELWPRLEDGLPATFPEALHRRIASADDAAVLYENVPVIMKHRLNVSDPARPPLPPSRAMSPFVKLPENQSTQHISPSANPSTNNSDSIKTSHPNPNIMVPNGDAAAGAPYYYSDIIRGEMEDQGFMSSASERSVTRNSMHGPPSSWRPARIHLNNQRDDLQETAAKRNDVGRKVNRIQPPNDIFHGSARHLDPQRAAQSDYPVDNSEGVDKIMAADLLLIGADKCVDVDERNIYETDTLKKASRRRQVQDHQWEASMQQSGSPVNPPMHRRCYTPDSLPDSRSTRNLYPYGLVDKSAEDSFQGNSHDLQFSDQSGVRERANRWRRRSRSLEGLLDDENESMFHQNPVRNPYTNVSHNRQAPLTYDNSQGNTWATPAPNQTPEVNSTSSATPENRQTTNMTTNGDFNGVDPWSEDNLWRESLRRVSLRHTRSLDHLDDCGPSGTSQANSSGRRSVDLLAAAGNPEVVRKPKVSRGVTYVNDSVAMATERRNRMRALNKSAGVPTSDGVQEDVRADARGADGLAGIPRQGERQFGGRYPPRLGPEQATGEQIAGHLRPGPNVPRGAYDRVNDHPRVARRRMVPGGGSGVPGEHHPEDSSLPPPASSENHQNQHRHFLGEDAPPSPTQSPQPQEPGPGFEIDREKLRQWDLMSSAPLPGMAGTAGGGGAGAAGGGGGKAAGLSGGRNSSSRPPGAAAGGGAEAGAGGGEGSGVTAGVVPSGRAAGSSAVPGGLPCADETAARAGDESAREDEASGAAARKLQQQESRVLAAAAVLQVGTASGTGSIRESAPVRHPKNDPASTMLIISQPTSMPTSSPAFVQPPSARVAATPQLKQQPLQHHGMSMQNGGVEIDGHVGGMGVGEVGMDGGSTNRRGGWRGGEGPVVGKAVPMLRWDKENTVEPSRRPPPEEPTVTQEGDFLTLQRPSRRRLVPPPWIYQCLYVWKQSASSPMRHEATNGTGIRGRVSRNSGDAAQANKERNRVDRGGGGGAGGRGEVSVSAGDLLGRTHEELVLLLIQLRRQSAAVSNAIDLCQADLRAQARLAELEMHRRVEHLKKLEELKKHLLELEKQYEKGKPLINLVDNMVKLGSLYRGNTDAQGQVRSWRGNGGEVITGPSPAKDRLQFNQRVQEQRLLAEERRDWSRLSPDHGELQAKVQQLYRLDRLLQEESVTIQSLQQDKELLEKALGGLRHKLQGSGMSSSGNLTGTSPRDMGASKGGSSASTVDPVEAERYRKQQRMLERELSRVRQLLAHNSKKLEETVAENARLEQELVVLRQKLQLSRRTMDNHGTSPSPASSSMTNPASPTGATASLEAELRRVQSAVGDLQRQRHELSVQVRQLTEKSHSLVEQIRPGPTGVAGAGPIPAKKRHHSSWMETDLDSMESVDCGIESPGQGLSPSRGLPMIQSYVHAPMESTPLYVNTTLGQHPDREEMGRRASEDPQLMANGYELSDGDALDEAQGYQAMDISEADDRMKRFYGIIPREKTEIKTVRIVKRESERRHRDRSSKRVVLVEDSSEGPDGGATSPSSSSALNRVLEEDPAEGDEGEGEDIEGVPEGAAAMAAYHSSHHHHHHHMQAASAATTPVASTSSSVPFSSGFLTSPEDDPILSQFFQRSMSLPRALGKQQRGHQPPPIPPPPPLRVASPRGSSAAVRRQQILHQRRSDVRERPRSAHEQLFGATSPDESPIPQPQHLPHHLSYPAYPLYSPSSPSSHCSASPPTPLYPQPQPGTVPVSDRAYPPPPPTPDSPPLIAYKSEAAREIALEMAAAALHSGSEDWANGGGRGRVKKRATPKEKRRHYTVSCSRPLELESIVIPKMGSARSRDDLDMEQVLRPRLNAPDVVRSTMSHRDFKYNEHTIDSVLGTPNKIVIPERYIPEQAPELSEEEQMQRLKKAEAIRKMLSETTPISAPEVEDTQQQKKTSVIKKKVAEEKRQRDHILQLNQILAKQVMEKSKMVAVRALATLPLHETSTDDDDLSSPVQPLPLTQQRDNFFS